ncbi:hypothetical protein F4776DRAFT_260169 [Hypoxylon sp. NC0597]|nr:hypothetical protein F4776DRAFT_260169 [Hypoxylon sp. NC0597]
MFNPWVFTAISGLLSGPADVQPKFNITAVSAQNGRSVLQCWQIDKPFSYSHALLDNGIAILDFGDVSKMSYTFVPPQYKQEPHNAPFNQWLIMLKGLGYITIPDDDTASAYITPGQVLFAADTADVSSKGHLSQFPGVTENIFVQIPTKDNQIPPHTVLYSGPCKPAESAHLSALASNVSSRA